MRLQPAIFNHRMIDNKLETLDFSVTKLSQSCAYATSDASVRFLVYDSPKTWEEIKYLKE